MNKSKKIKDVQIANLNMRLFKMTCKVNLIIDFFDKHSGHDVQHYQDLEWDWEKELSSLIETKLR